MLRLLAKGVTKTYKKSKYIIVDVKVQEYVESMPCVRYQFVTAVTN